MTMSYVGCPKPLWCSFAALAVTLLVANGGIVVMADGETPPQDSSLDSLCGVVVDYLGNPVPEACVYAVEYLSGSIDYNSPDDVSMQARSAYPFYFPMVNSRGCGKTIADANGRFEITGMYAGTFTVLAVHPEHGMGVIEYAANPRGRRGQLEVRLAKPTFIEGSIIGSPAVPTTTIRLWEPQGTTPEDGEPSFVGLRTISPKVRLDAEGRFRVGPVHKGGKWWLTIATDHAELVDVPVECVYGATTSFQLDLTGPERVHGMVTGPAGEPLEGVVVQLASKPSTRDAAERPAVYAALTNQDGEYALGGVPHGEYDLSAFRYTLGRRGEILRSDVEYRAEVKVPAHASSDTAIQIPAFVLHPGDAAPDFQTRTRTGVQFRLSEQRGKAVLLHFIDSWSKPGGLTYEDILRARDIGRNRFEVLTINMELNIDDEWSNWRPLRTEWPVADLGPADSNAVARVYTVLQPPATYLVGPDGKIITDDLSATELVDALTMFSGDAPSQPPPLAEDDQ